MRIAGLVIASWIVGVLTYGGALFVFFGEIMTIDSPDFNAMLFWSAIAYGPSVIIVQLPVLFAVRGLFPRVGVVALGAVGLVLGIVPVLVLSLLWGGISWDALTSPEIFLFLCLFVGAGATLGLGFRRAVPPGS